ncbi:hypothetical protein D0T50_12580 [Bacteroides sp. 214]|uniref:fimbrillin family protein n=1 Tax=Bacteroides sp. 214 TaxID=2302935 RepID=UPI0013D3A91D|nr:fimbrillin family protein [Bacteroides sp. 214]NDW13720.1 hypothetical protein [Bacteroides sp. 214]
MKKNISYYALPVAALLLLTGCSNDNETLQDSPTDGRQITISAAQGSLNETRLAYDYQVGGTMDIAWSANDAFYVIDTHSNSATDGKTFTIQGNGGGNTAKFSGTQPAGATFNAFYPAAKATGKTWSECEFDMSGQEQNGNASTAHLSDYNFMTLTQEITSTDLEESTLSFQHGIAIFRIEVTLPAGKTPGELQLKTRESDPYDASPYGFVINKGVNGALRRVSHTTSMTLTDVNSNQFTAYMAVLPTTLKGGLSIEIYCTDHSAYKKDIAFETWSFTAGKIYHAKVKNTDLVDISHTVYHGGLIASMNLDNNQIKSAADLKYVMETVPMTFAGETFTLTTDIHVTASEWKAVYMIGEYTGLVEHNLNGNNHIVSGRLINKAYDYYFGFIGRSSQSEITGLHVTADIVNERADAENIGGIIGQSNGSTISNCSFSGSIGGESAQYVGGICGSIDDYNAKSSTFANNNNNTCTLKGITTGGLIGAIWNSTPIISVCNSLCSPPIGANL